MRLAANRIEYMGFHQIHERKQAAAFVSQVNDWPKELLLASSEIVSTHHPGAQRCLWEAQVMRCFQDAVDRGFSWILGERQVNRRLAHECRRPPGKFVDTKLHEEEVSYTEFAASFRQQPRTATAGRGGCARRGSAGGGS